MDATIVIPTKNGGLLLKKVLEKVFSQKTDFSYEVICIDSGSSDESISIIKKTDAKLIQISPEEFGHGKTRNYGASLGTGEFILFITQDALPADDYWLDNMLKAIRLDDNIAGCFGKHLPYPGCNFMDKRDIEGMFEGFGNTNTIYKNEDEERYEKDAGYRSILAFFSDNNSCIRRSVWEKYPYPEVDFSEDQIWMRSMIEKGYSKVYCPYGAVYHSHNYDTSTYFKRYYDEFKALYRIHGYIIMDKKIYVPAAIVKHVLSDAKYIWSTESLKASKLSALNYSIRRNYARYVAGYIGGHYHLKSEKEKDRLDKKYSQQYIQRNS